MTEHDRRSGYLRWTLLVGMLAIAGIVVAARMAPETSPVGRRASETERFVVELPRRGQQLLEELRERYAKAKAEFAAARRESERALVSQLQEAKERGSVPPL